MGDGGDKWSCLKNPVSEYKHTMMASQRNLWKNIRLVVLPINETFSAICTF